MTNEWAACKSGDAGQKDDSRPRQSGAGRCEISSCYSEQRTGENLQMVYFWYFSFNIFEPWLTANPWLKGDCCTTQHLIEQTKG